MLILFSETKHGENTPLTRALHYYEPNATWTNEIGVKTEILREKQDEKDSRDTVNNAREKNKTRG
jgi:hypothetical protein